MIVETRNAILALEPNALFHIVNDEIVWISEDIDQPSDEDIATKKTELQAIEDAKQYQRDRKAEYPSIEDCVHALLDGGDTLTDLQALRQAVKDKYPKE